MKHASDPALVGFIRSFGDPRVTDSWMKISSADVSNTIARVFDRRLVKRPRVGRFDYDTIESIDGVYYQEAGPVLGGWTGHGRVGIRFDTDGIWRFLSANGLDTDRRQVEVFFEYLLFRERARRDTECSPDGAHLRALLHVLKMKW